MWTGAGHFGSVYRRGEQALVALLQTQVLPLGRPDPLRRSCAAEPQTTAVIMGPKEQTICL